MNSKYIFVLIILFSIFHIHGAYSKDKISTVLLKHAGREVSNTELAVGEIIEINPEYKYYYWTEYYLIYKGESVIDYRFEDNKLFVNDKLRGISINKTDDINQISSDTDCIILNIEPDDKIIKKLIDIKIPVYLKANKLNKSFIENLGEYNNLEYLDLSDADDTDLINSENIKFPRNMKYLNFYNINPNADVIRKIGALAELKYLNLSCNNSITTESFQYLGELRKLIDLNIRSTNIDNEALKIIRNYSSLRYLDLSETGISGRGIRYLNNYGTLETLILSNTKISNIGLMHLSKFRVLKKLKLNICHNINSKGGVYLAKIKSLEYLSLDYTDIGDEVISGIDNLVNLKYLCLSRTGITIEGIKKLSGLVNLEELDLSGLHIDSGAVEYFPNKEKLTRLDLSSTDIDDEGMKIVGSFRNLRHLVLMSTKITDKGLGYIYNLPGLSELYLIDTKIEDLKRYYPGSTYSRTFIKKESIEGDWSSQAVCSDTVPVFENAGTFYRVIGQIVKDEEVMILDSKECRDYSQCILIRDHYFTKYKKYIKSGTPAVIVGIDKENIKVSLDVDGEKVLLDTDKDGTYNIKGFYKIKTKNNIIGWVPYNSLNKRYNDPAGNRFRMIRAIHIQPDTEEKFKEVMERLRNGESPVELARRYSIAETNENKGDTGFLYENELEYPFTGLDDIYYPGEIKVIKNGENYHIFVSNMVIWFGERYRFIFSY